MNQPHPAQVTPSWYGDFVGHYEGDTLVIDTVGTKTDRPFAMIDLYGTPYTERLCTWWNVIGCSTTKMRKKAWIGTQKRIGRRRGRHRPQLPGQVPAAPFHGRG